MLQTGADFSPCGAYRYALWRVWDEGKAWVLFIGLNPSTADARRDDPTVRRCIGYAREWGYGGVYVANLFAYRATEPRELKRARDPVGPENDSWLARLASNAGLVIAAWGNHGAWQGRAAHVLASLPSPLYCLAVTARGVPGHPLYLRRECQPRLFR